MTTIHFIGQEHDNGEATGIYHLTIDGKPWTYNQPTDILTDTTTGRNIRRSWLSYDILTAFYQAWDPNAFQAAKDAAGVGGIPDDSENPTSPLYCPAKPHGEPMELRPGHATTVDLTDLINAAIAKEGAR